MNRKLRGRKHFAVGPSISVDLGYDTKDALEYVLEYKFQGFQVFMNSSVIDDVKLHNFITKECFTHEITIVAHAPGTLNYKNATNVSLNTAAERMLRHQNEKFFIHHFDETVDEKEILEAIKYINDKGFTLALENYFKMQISSMENFQKYLRIFELSYKLDLQIIPVVDFGRFFTSKVGLGNMALNLIENAMSLYSRLKLPIILHMVDLESPEKTTPSSWRAVGSGIIPYPDIINIMIRNENLIEMLVFEHEDRENPLESRSYIISKLKM